VLLVAVNLRLRHHVSLAACKINESEKAAVFTTFGTFAILLIYYFTQCHILTMNYDYEYYIAEWKYVIDSLGCCRNFLKIFLIFA